MASIKVLQLFQKEFDAVLDYGFYSQEWLLFLVMTSSLPHTVLNHTKYQIWKSTQ